MNSILYKGKDDFEKGANALRNFSRLQIRSLSSLLDKDVNRCGGYLDDDGGRATRYSNYLTKAYSHEASIKWEHCNGGKDRA